MESEGKHIIPTGVLFCDVVTNLESFHLASDHKWLGETD